MHCDSRLARLDRSKLRVENPYKVPATLFADEQMVVESDAVTELLEMLELQRTVERFAEASPESSSLPPTITQVAITPNFHKGKGIPIGTVLATRGFIVPQAIGNDVNCGMRLHVTSLDALIVMGRVDELTRMLRQMFFEGGRAIPMTRQQREALFSEHVVGVTRRSHEMLELSEAKSTSESEVGRHGSVW